jgi:hypothetical protein
MFDRERGCTEIGTPILACPSLELRMALTRFKFNRSPPPNKTGFISPDLLVDPPFPYSFLRAAQMAMHPPSDQELQVSHFRKSCHCGCRYALDTSKLIR